MASTFIYHPINCVAQEDVRLDRCRASVWSEGYSYGHQCRRKIVATRCVEGEKCYLGFCRQHDPEAARARQNARRERLDGGDGRRSGQG